MKESAREGKGKKIEVEECGRQWKGKDVMKDQRGSLRGRKRKREGNQRSGCNRKGRRQEGENVEGKGEWRRRLGEWEP